MRKVLHFARLEINGRTTDIRLLKEIKGPKTEYWVIYNGQRLRCETGRVENDTEALYWFVGMVDLAIEATR